jgi:hypothetical protein
MCERCDGTGWVCESHINKPWEDSGSDKSCNCGGAGRNCDCNPDAKFPPTYRVIASINHDEIDILH